MNDRTATQGQLLYLDDLTVGRRFSTASHVLQEDEIVAFARAYDPQPFHLDKEAAKTSIFGGLVASGWQTAGITMRLLVETGLPIAGGLVGVESHLKWPRATRAGDALTVTAEIMAARTSRSRPDRGMVEIRAETRNQHGDLLQIFTAMLVVPCRPSV